MDWLIKLQSALPEGKEPRITIQYHVIAYDESGWGDNRSQDFAEEEEAINYASSLEKRFGAVITKSITMDPIHVRVPFEKP